MTDDGRISCFFVVFHGHCSCLHSFINAFDRVHKTSRLAQIDFRNKNVRMGMSSNLDSSDTNMWH